MSFPLVVGLGNPGPEYAASRHNLGWMVLDALARRHGLSWESLPRFEADVARWNDADGRHRWLLKPMTYMNESGRAVQAFADFHRIPITATAVVYDDVGIELGLVKVSVQGSDGGHNGVASLLAHCGTGFARFRIGIGPRTPPEMDLKDFVLGRFSPSQQNQIEQNFESILQGLALLLESGADRAMNLLNRRDQHESEQT